MTIGDQASHLFAGINLVGLDGASEKPVAILARLALVTIFQALEHLPDCRASEAIRSRTDWKYALHLALDGPGFSPQALCDFRQHLLADPASQQVFQRILDRLAEVDRLDSQDMRRMDATCVLTVVCALSRLDLMARAMHLALESIAANHPEWLRANALPHWYERYTQASMLLRQPHAREEWDELACTVAADAAYLLETISKTHVISLEALPEIQGLQKEWRRQQEQCSGEIRWRSPRCADCSAMAGLLERTG